MDIILVTTNLHKLREFKEMFKRLTRLQLSSLHPFPDYTPPEETGATFKENAALKASHAAKELQSWVLADDSGLVVPALKGQPGVHSRRWAGLHATDLENCQKLLREMEGFEGETRVAYFECALAVASPDGSVKCFEGSCEGRIATELRGRHGFGYDPLFIKTDYEKTYAELDESIKNRISHRRKAFDRLLPFLESLNVAFPDNALLH